MTTIKNDYLKFGSADAPLKLEAFINVACRGTATIYRLAKEVLPPYIENGQIEVIVKLYDKPREELLHGALIHWTLDNEKPNEALDVIGKLLETQAEWHELSNKELKRLLVDTYNLQEEERLENVDISLAITAEAIEREVKIVPTLFFNGEKLLGFTYELEPSDLKQAIETSLAKL
ncbi:thioredoxin domain-containing protein [Lysinibacillus sp. NPDC096418]|uniref:thioredoxin domain-containing protein n=1 Tax=Lysinibacillus sp. NPDC096418 TaxID=3364138 RepID=UPI0038303D17